MQVSHTQTLHYCVLSVDSQSHIHLTLTALIHSTYSFVLILQSKFSFAFYFINSNKKSLLASFCNANHASAGKDKHQKNITI